MRRRSPWRRHAFFHGHHDWLPPGCVPPRPHGSWRALRHELRLYYGAHLHRRLFLWFGVAIFITAAVMMGVAHWLEPSWSQHERPSLWFLLIPAFILWTASGVVARRISRPLYELARVSREIGQGNLKARVSMGPGHFDEIAMVAHAVDEMVTRIEKQLADQRELLAGVSHELRTPLARLRVLMEIVRERGAGAQTLDQMEREVVEIDALVGELLASARLDFQSVDARTLDARDVAGRALERAGVDPDRLRVDLPDPHVVADPTLLGRALANLLDNAKKHGRGVSALHVHAADGHVIFDVEDQGPGVGEAARARAAKPEGSLGLGLVLVGRIAAAHGGSFALENRPEGGARASLRIAHPPVSVASP